MIINKIITISATRRQHSSLSLTLLLVVCYSKLLLALVPCLFYDDMMYSQMKGAWRKWNSVVYFSSSRLSGQAYRAVWQNKQYSLVAIRRYQSLHASDTVGCNHLSLTSIYMQVMGNVYSSVNHVLKHSHKIRKELIQCNSIHNCLLPQITQ